MPRSMRAVVLCGTLIYELIGPGVAKWTLQRAGRDRKRGLSPPSRRGLLQRLEERIR